MFIEYLIKSFKRLQVGSFKLTPEACPKDQILAMQGRVFRKSCLASSTGRFSVGDYQGINRNVLENSNICMTLLHHQVRASQCLGIQSIADSMVQLTASCRIYGTSFPVRCHHFGGISGKSTVFSGVSSFGLRGVVINLIEDILLVVTW
jgi:hypothetical protein